MARKERKEVEWAYMQAEADNTALRRALAAADAMVEACVTISGDLFRCAACTGPDWRHVGDGHRDGCKLAAYLAARKEGR